MTCRRTAKQERVKPWPPPLRPFPPEADWQETPVDAPNIVRMVRRGLLWFGALAGLAFLIAWAIVRWR